ncbi:MAG: YhdP family phospholipid transporter [Gammaproteobacteria bacterium]
MGMKHVGRGLWYAVAALVILAAVAVAAVRALLPMTTHYQRQIEALAGRYLGLPVQCSRVDARWYGLHPVLQLQNVVLRDPQRGGVLLRVREVRLGVNLGALLERQLEPATITLEGATLSLVRDPDGRIHPADVPPSARLTPEQLLARFAAIGAVRLRVTGSDLLWWDRQAGAAPVRFTRVAVSLERSGRGYLLSGAADLPTSFGHQVSFVAESDGTGPRPLETGGRFYLRGADLNVPAWTRGRSVAGVRAAGGRADLEVWGAWAGGRLESLEGKAQLRALRLRGAGAPAFAADQASGRFAFGRAGAAWWVRLQDLVVQRDAQAPQVMNLTLVRRPAVGTVAPQWEVRADRLRLREVAALFQLSDVPNAALRAELQALHPEGELRNLTARLQDVVGHGPRYSLRGRFEDLSSGAWGRWPAVAGLTGRVDAGPDGVQLDLDSRGVRVDAAEWFAAPLTFDRLSGRLTLTRSGAAGWVLQTPDLALANADLAARARLLLEWPSGSGSPVVDLQVNLERGSMAAVRRYLPIHGIPPHGRAWMDRALVSGDIVSGVVVLQGPLREFPFPGGTGTFEARFNVSDVILDYDRDWPRMEDVEAEVVFRGDALNVHLVSAKVFDVSVLGADARIPRLGRGQVTEMHLRAQGPAADLLRILQESPVHKTHGAFLDGLQAGGAARLDFQLQFPTEDPEARRYSGTVAFSDGMLDGAAWGLNLQNINGTLAFSDHSYQASGIDAMLDGRAVTIGVSTPAGESRSTVRVAGAVAATSLAQWSPMAAHWLKGTTAWDAALVIPWQPTGAKVPELPLTLHTDLHGMAVDLPAPFGKTAARDRELWLETTVPRRPDAPVQLRYGKVLSGVLSRESGVPEPGEWWFARLDSPVVSGKVWVPVTYPKGPAVVMDLDRLQLPSAATGGGAAPDPRGLPALRISSRQFRYGDQELGQLSLQAVRVAQGLRVEHLSLTSARMHLEGSGEWLDLGGGRQETRFAGALTSPDLGRLIAGFGFAGSVRGGKTQCDMTVHWPDGPTRVGLKGLQGTFKLKVDKGRLVDVSPGAGRVFGLLSLQALPRRLSLDFSDLFKKGFSFDHLQGTFSLRNANAYTDNLTLKGPSADLVITGRIGLLARDYDQTVTVLPNLGGSLPLAGALAGGPAVGAALFVAEHMLRGPIQDITRYQYSVTGSWEHPVVTRTAGGLAGFLEGSPAPRPGIAPTLAIPKPERLPAAPVRP